MSIELAPDNSQGPDQQAQGQAFFFQLVQPTSTEGFEDQSWFSAARGEPGLLLRVGGFNTQAQLTQSPPSVWVYGEGFIVHRHVTPSQMRDMAATLLSAAVYFERLAL